MGRPKIQGERYLKERLAFNAIVARCNYENTRSYKDYGGRGIKCLYSDYKDFLADVGPAPTKKHTIDRIDNNGNYEKGNCRWITMSEQARNKRSNVLITINGVTKIQSDWAKELNIPVSTLHNRIAIGSKNPLVSVNKNWSIYQDKVYKKYHARFDKVVNKVHERKNIGAFKIYEDAVSACEKFIKSKNQSLWEQ